MRTSSPLPHDTRLPPRQRAAAVYRQPAARGAAYAAPVGAPPAVLDAAAQTATRALQRRYPLVSALLAELELMDDGWAAGVRTPRRG